MKTFIKFILSIAFILLIMGCPKDDNPEPGTDQATFDLYTSPSDPQIFTAHHPDGTDVTYLGEKDRDGVVTSINAYTVQYPGEAEPYYVTLNNEGIPTEVIASNGCVFNYEWESSTKVIVTATTPDGGYEVRIPVDFSETSTKSYGDQEFKNIRSNISTEIRVEPITTTEKSIGKNKLAGAFLSVDVEKCGEKFNDAQVWVKITPWEGGNLYLPHIEGQDGSYAAFAPTFDEPVDYNKLCQSIVGYLDLGCNFVKDVDATAGCTALGVAIDFLTIPSGEAALIIAACKGSWTALQAYCKTLGESGNGDTSIGSYLCNLIVSKIENPPTAPSYTARAIAIIPGEGTEDGGIQPFTPGSTFGPSWSIDASGEKKIKNFKTDPFDPAPEQSYIASAKIYCPEETGTDVNISIVGTDGYTNSKTVTLYETSIITLNVPGASQGVNDKITINVEDGPSKVIGIIF